MKKKFKTEPLEVSIKRMRGYIAEGMGVKESDLPGFEASVISLASEALYQRKKIRQLLVLLDRARPKLPIGSHIYNDICKTLRIHGRGFKS
jgi:hypothetical protein